MTGLLRTALLYAAHRRHEPGPFAKWTREPQQLHRVALFALVFTAI